MKYESLSEEEKTQIRKSNILSKYSRNYILEQALEDNDIVEKIVEVVLNSKQKDDFEHHCQKIFESNNLSLPKYTYEFFYIPNISFDTKENKYSDYRSRFSNMKMIEKNYFFFDYYIENYKNTNNKLHNAYKAYWNKNGSSDKLKLIVYKSEKPNHKSINESEIHSDSGKEIKFPSMQKISFYKEFELNE